MSANTSGFFTQSLADRDPELFAAVTDELGRQRDEIELIASENIVSAAVLEAQGTVLTNKYAEGYPGRRYYGGCQYVDVAENLAIDRAKQLFNCDFVNVQPNSGSQANQARPFHVRSTLPVSARLPTRSALMCWPTWPTLPV